MNGKKFSIFGTLFAVLMVSGCGWQITTSDVAQSNISEEVQAPLVEKNEKEIIDDYFKDKDLLYERILKDVGYDVEVDIADDTDSWCVGKEPGYCHDKEIKIYCNDCNCNKLWENTVPLMVMLISEQVDMLIGRPGYIQVELYDMYFCDSKVKIPVSGRGCGGTKTHAECY